jgi:thiamine kinase-like enzyme
LPDLHHSLRDYISTREPHQFASDAAAYELAVDECVVQAISDYAAAYASRRATAIAAQFGPVAEWQSKNRDRFPTHAIHGDFVASNVLVAQSDSSFKVIDWERTMIGFPHRDLAALIRNLPARMERPLLELYAQAVPDLSAADHTEAFVLSKRMQKLKAAAIGSVRLLQRDCGTPAPDGRRRGSCRVLQARIEQNLGVAEALGERLLET